MMTDDQLSEWKALCEKATPNWRLESSRVWGHYTEYANDDPSFAMKFNIPICMLFSPGDVYEVDEFIANSTLILESRTAFPLLIAEVERLRNKVDILYGYVDNA